ncbi:Uncharacterised protein [Bordetella pertussis]|nr:Uncharacterised protein [Bordetella pertussis]
MPERRSVPRAYRIRSIPYRSSLRSTRMRARGDENGRRKSWTSSGPSISPPRTIKRCKGGCSKEKLRPSFLPSKGCGNSERPRVAPPGRLDR